MAREAEAFVDLPRRIRAIECVEVDASDLIVEQVAALLGGPVDSDLGDGLGIVVATTDRPKKASRKPALPKPARPSLPGFPSR